MPEITDQRLRDLLSRLPDVPDDVAGRAGKAGDKILAALADPEPDPGRARNAALHFLMGELVKRGRTGRHSASLIEVELAATTLGIGITVCDWNPARPDGQWPPGGPQLTAVFFRTLTATLKGDPR